MLKNLENPCKCSHTFLNVQYYPSNTGLWGKKNSVSKSLTDLDKMNEKPVWCSFSWQVWFSLNTSRHFTNTAAYQITLLRTFRQRHIVLWRSVIAKWAVFLTQQMPVQNGMTKYRLVSKQSDNKLKWPMHTGQERGQWLTFLASQQNKVHKTTSVHRLYKSSEL